MHPYLMPLLYFIARYIHIVCATLLVGGTLFYEMVVPIAIDELRPEQKLWVFARARWVFRGIVWASVVLIIISGILSTRAHWARYTREESRHVENQLGNTTSDTQVIAAIGRPGWWWAAHATAGILSLFIALALTIGPVPPASPIRWMRLNLGILLLVMFLATATRQARLSSESVHPQPHQAEEVHP